MSSKTTAKKEQTKLSLVPKLRFPEFREADGWISIPLNRLAIRSTQKNRDEKIDRVLTNSAEFGVVDQRDFFEKDIATQGKLEGYFVVELGTYVYNPRISSTAPVGPISKNKIGTGVISPLYTVFKFKDDRNDFYEQFFKTTGWHAYMRQASSTGARHDRMAMSSDDFMAMPLPMPSPAEQQRIAKCISSLDEVIAAQARKLDALKTHKKGLMERLFPSEGATKPRFRFPEFQNAGKWKTKVGGDLFANRKEKGEAGLPIYSVTVNDGMVPRASFDRNFYDIEDPAGNRKVHKGDIAYNMMRMWQGAQGVAPVDCIVSPAYVVLKPRDGVCSDFFAHFFGASPFQVGDAISSHLAGYKFSPPQWK